MNVVTRDKWVLDNPIYVNPDPNRPWDHTPYPFVIEAPGPFFSVKGDHPYTGGMLYKLGPFSEPMVDFQNPYYDYDLDIESLVIDMRHLEGLAIRIATMQLTQARRLMVLNGAGRGDVAIFGHERHNNACTFDHCKFRGFGVYRWTNTSDLLMIRPNFETGAGWAVPKAHRCTVRIEGDTRPTSEAQGPIVLEHPHVEDADIYISDTELVEIVGGQWNTSRVFIERSTGVDVGRFLSRAKFNGSCEVWVNGSKVYPRSWWRGW